MLGEFQSSCFRRKGTFLGDVAFHTLVIVLLSLPVSHEGMMAVVAKVFFVMLFVVSIAAVVSFGQEGVHIEESVKVKFQLVVGDYLSGKEEAVKVGSITYGGVGGLFVVFF